MLIKFNDLPNKEEFKCYQCGKWLSVSPVFYNVENGYYICGRCNFDPDNVENVQHQMAYETLAIHMIFPCVNSDKGCSAELKWNDDVVKHEKQCIFTKIDCPLFDISGLHKCSWSGSYAELHQHVQQIHADHVLNPPHLKLDFENKKDQMYFTSAFGKDFLIYIKFDQSSNKLYGLVQYIGVEAENEFYRYQFELWDSDNQNSVILRRNKMETAYDLDRKTFDFHMSLQIDIPTIKNLLNNSDTVFCKIGILKKSNKEIAAVKLKLPTQVVNPVKTQEAPQNVQAKVNQDVINNLVCPACNEYMAPPIYICVTGHSICNTCRLIVKNCPLCKQSIRKTRNHTMEKLTERMQFPCRNKFKNCSFVSNISTIIQHENQCKNSDERCVLKCKWYGSPQTLVDHLKRDHADYLLDITSIVRRNIKDKVTATYHIICFDQEVFRASCKHSTTTGPIKFNIQHFGMRKPTYKYVLEFFDTTGHELELIVSQLCQKPTELPTEAFKNSLVIPLEMLEPFLFEKSYLLFQIKLIKLKT